MTIAKEDETKARNKTALQNAADMAVGGEGTVSGALST
jgi:hypothetical protein